MGTLWHGGTIYTLQNPTHTVEALFVENGIISDLGNVSELREQYQKNITSEINLEGSFLYPGFVDSHLHMIGHGEKLIRLDLSNMTSIEEILSHIERRVKTIEKGEWIIAEGWNENNFEKQEIIHRGQLDNISTEHPIMLTRVCRHAIVVNSCALKLAGIDESTENPEGGVIVKDDKGIPTGYLLDQAQELVKSIMPLVSDSYLTKALSHSIDDLLKKGYVGGHTEDLNYYNGFEHTFQTFLNIIDGVKMKFRTNMLVHHEVVDDMHMLGYHFGDVSPFIQLGAMKIFADGSIGGRTALLKEPYSDEPLEKGVAIQSLEDLKELVQKARIYEMPVAIHAIGDLALEYALDAITTYSCKEGLRDRIIHAQVVNEQLIQKLKKLPVVLDIQPRFVASDFPWVIERLGEKRIKYAYAWKTFLKEKIMCAGGSDAPIEPIDPLLGIHAAVTRRSPNEYHHICYHPEEKLTPFEAIQLFTVGSAYAIGEEGFRGKIKKGYLADFTVFDKDLLNISGPDEIIDAKVLMTVIDNTVMYKRNEF
ncbi:amidohydrolase [Anaerobacillus alkalidiazotrophicus]|uniref:Amidohydrolase n=1 Tax=Anaerobacillus alkalidiazotrophicus TaxID=472963 RepID=A0A1S2M166_9BACI|nr:amidohydrolase [Anaerobacillus alkalidiazotrophicus]OIJ18240.1 amidohydrolase [Anaerobacillus alkalidiazotrophicus]OIJ19719.1 amidohydrolase [Anaerobacillus alkalidiazotrophicus]